MKTSPIFCAETSPSWSAPASCAPERRHPPSCQGGPAPCKKRRGRGWGWLWTRCTPPPPPPPLPPPPPSSRLMQAGGQRGTGCGPRSALWRPRWRSCRAPCPEEEEEEEEEEEDCSGVAENTIVYTSTSMTCCSDHERPASSQRLLLWSHHSVLKQVYHYLVSLPRTLLYIYAPSSIYIILYYLFVDCYLLILYNILNYWIIPLLDSWRY